MNAQDFFFFFYARFGFYIRFSSILPRFISPSDVAAPFLHPAAAALMLVAPTRSSEVLRRCAQKGKTKSFYAREGREGRATGFAKGAYDIAFLRAMGVTRGVSRSCFFGGFSGAFTDANAVPWSSMGEAGRRHVSSSACQCKSTSLPVAPTGRKRERFAAFLGEVLVVAPPSPPKPTIHNTSSQHPMTFQRPRILHNFARIKEGWNLV